MWVFTKKKRRKKRNHFEDKTFGQNLMVTAGSRRLLTYRKLPDGEVSTSVPRRRKDGRDGVNADELNAFRRKVGEQFRPPTNKPLCSRERIVDFIVLGLVFSKFSTSRSRPKQPNSTWIISGLTRDGVEIRVLVRLGFLAYIKSIPKAHVI
jgi:hypothetical protein